ncbi:MAG TPA: hypothetical protein VNZ66_05755 [Aeromicrobium sp.]|nr:hypothetical protein [Aeromicrobium sp.]
MDLETIKALAREAHDGQTDLTGRPYFEAHLTPIAAAAAVFGPEAEAAGWLHDIVEDTDITADDLVARGIPSPVVDAVVAVTRRSDESYAGLIERAAADPLGVVVKLADNTWNIICNPALAEVDEPRARTMLLDRYLPARTRLLAAAELTEDSPEVVQMTTILTAALKSL